MRESVNKTMKSSWLYLLISKPKLYLYTLCKHTAFVGIVTLIMCYCYFHSSYNTHKIPIITHTLISVAIGLLLVFRNQTSYDRWSTASKNFYDLQGYFGILSFRINSLNFNKEDKEQIKLIVSDFCDNFVLYLKEGDFDIAKKVENNYLNDCRLLVSIIDKQTTLQNGIEKPDVNFLMKVINDLLITCSSCSRIKNTPIPVSYEMHIKISIFFYICSLPFGLFYDMGLWSVLMVMLVYYIMAGIEIISKEIENPFHGDPNDLPVKNLMDKIKNNFNYQIDTLEH